MKKSIMYLVSVSDPRHPQAEPFLMSATPADVPSILSNYAGCVVIFRVLQSFSDLVTLKINKNECSKEKESN